MAKDKKGGGPAVKDKKPAKKREEKEAAKIAKEREQREREEREDKEIEKKEAAKIARIKKREEDSKKREEEAKEKEADKKREEESKEEETKEEEAAAKKREEAAKEEAAAKEKLSNKEGIFITEKKDPGIKINQIKSNSCILTAQKLINEKDSLSTSARIEHNPINHKDSKLASEKDSSKRTFIEHKPIIQEESSSTSTIVTYKLSSNKSLLAQFITIYDSTVSTSLKNKNIKSFLQQVSRTILNKKPVVENDCLSARLFNTELEKKIMNIDEHKIHDIIYFMYNSINNEKSQNYIHIFWNIIPLFYKTKILNKLDSTSIYNILLALESKENMSLEAWNMLHNHNKKKIFNDLSNELNNEREILDLFFIICTIIQKMCMRSVWHKKIGH